MKLYHVKKHYIDYLSKIDQHIIISDNIKGFPLRINGLCYFIPISLSKQDDYQGRKSAPTIFRMYDFQKEIFYGKCLFSNMFCVPYKELKEIYLKNQEIKETLQFIDENKQRIQQAALRLYKQKIKKYQQNYLQYTVDFELIEKAAIEWEIKKYGKHYNRFPDEHFFLVNPQSDGKTEYDLMNKNKRIARISYDNRNYRIVEIKKIYNESYAPLECFKNRKIHVGEMNAWFKGRGIPSWRDGLDDFLDNLGIDNKDVLLNKAYGLSLTDQYWMNPVEQTLEWKNINFFDHAFNSDSYIEAIFENKIVDQNDIDFYSPNNTSDGMLKKAWIVGEDKKRYLLKGSFKSKELEPFNEVLAGFICKAIHLDYTKYTIDLINKMPLSKCECFITKDTELISAYALLKKESVDFQDNSLNLYKKYIDLLENNGIENAKTSVGKMFILDYLIVNQDRHLGNFGIIRDVETLKWLKIAPNFDSGQAMYSQKEIYEMNFENTTGCFFNDKNMDFDKILDNVCNQECMNDIDFIALEKVPDLWEKELLKYQKITMFTDEKINVLINGLKIRINKLEKRTKKA